MNILAVAIFSLVTFLFYKTYDKRTVALMIVLSLVTLFFTQSFETVTSAMWGIVTGLFSGYIITKKK